MGRCCEGGRLLRHLGVEWPPSLKRWPKAHGLHYFVHPGEADSVIGVKEIQTLEIARHLMTMKVFCCREDGGQAVKYGPALYRAQLGGAEDQWWNWY
jgi:hypothetical protein